MAFSKNPTTATGFKPKNKLRRQAAHLSIKKAREAEKRDMRHRRKREEAKDASLREERLKNNVPQTIDNKRVWDEPVGDDEDVLGWAVDVERLAKKRKLDQEAAEKDGEEGTLAKLKKRDQEQEDSDEDSDEEEDDDADSMLDSDNDDDSDAFDSDDSEASRPTKKKRAASPDPSVATTTATNMELSPEFLKQKFPQLFDPQPEPKILITTSINSSLHKEAETLTSFFPNSTYIRRTAHAHAHTHISSMAI